MAISKTPRNKMIGNKDFKRNPSIRAKEKTFYFPMEHISVKAATKEEAVAKMSEIKKNKK